MPISVKAAKAKGRRLQQDVRDKIQLLLKPYGVVEDDVKSTTMGEGGEDVQLSPLARRLLPISVECKSRKAFAVYKDYEQSDKASGTNEPVLIIRGDRKPALALVDLDYYFMLEACRIRIEQGTKE